ncbi:MAG TPA: GNAT family N-acetyltransferase, partial [Acidimicrobiales bacterium]|nr:GNAT family N-acetyltransferase [Acidimicrobiales bacterium]
ERKPSGAFIGWTGVTKPYWFPDMMPTPEIGWFIDRELWSQGLATEGARAALHFVFEERGEGRVIGIYNAENIASGRVMEKLGMTFWKEVPHPRFGFPLRIYEASAVTGNVPGVASTTLRARSRSMEACQNVYESETSPTRRATAS